jgi:ribosomal protein L7Ae-like RNA K-turn-binding protein
VNKVLSLLGLAKKAGRLEAGEEPVGTAARVHGIRLILLASDAADNTARRAERFAEEGACLCARIPATKEQLGGAVGRGSCAMLALSDVGFASAIADRLAELNEEEYGALAERLSVKAARAAERKELKKQGKRRPRKK